PRHPAQHASPRSPPRLYRAVVRPRARGARDRAGRHLPQIVPDAMTDTDMPGFDQEDRRRRNRRMLLAIFALFFGSMLLAGLLRFSGWRPEGTRSHGELLEPPVDLREARLALLAGGDYAWNPGERQWRLVVAPPTACDVACDDIARDLDVVWRTLGHRADKVDVRWLCAQADCSVPSPLRGARRVRTAGRGTAGPARVPGVGAGAAGTAGVPVDVIDPHGFVILRYAPGADAAGIRADLGKLLKLM